MADTKDLVVRLTLQNEKLLAANKKAQASFQKTQKKSATLKDSIGKLKLSYLAVAAAVGVAIRTVGKFIKAAAKQEKAERTLAAAMKQAGTFTEKAFKENLKYASSLQKITTFGDEAILGVQKLLTNFGLEGEELKSLTKATLDLAAAKGMDLTSAADLVAKSVGSSTNALTRYGIQVTGAVGSTERAQTAVENITKLFGGAAAAEADTFSGTIEQTKNALGDLAERIGAKLFPVLSPILKTITRWVGQSDTLKSLTIDLIRLQDEQSQIIKNLNDESKGYTKTQKEIIALEGQSLALQIDKKLLQISQRYKDITKTGIVFKGELQRVNEAIRNQEKIVEEDRKRLEEFRKTGILVESQLKLVQVSTEALNKLEQKKIDLQKEVIEGEAEVAKAIENGNINRAQQEVLGDKLIKNSLARAEALKAERDAEGIEPATPKTPIITPVDTSPQKQLELLRFTGQEKLAAQLEIDMKEQELLQAHVDQKAAIEEAARQKRRELEIQDEAERANRIIAGANLALNTVSSVTSAIVSSVQARVAAGKAGSGAARKVAIFEKATSIAQGTVATILATIKALKNPPGPPYSIPQSIAAGVQGAASVAAIAATPIPKFAQGGVIGGLRGGFGGEDGIISAQNGESVLNRQATAVLGADAIQALNSGQSVNNNIAITVQDGRGAVDMLDEYFRTRGTSDRGLSL